MPFSFLSSPPGYGILTSDKCPYVLEATHANSVSIVFKHLSP